MPELHVNWKRVELPKLWRVEADRLPPQGRVENHHALRQPPRSSGNLTEDSPLVVKGKREKDPETGSLRFGPINGGS